MWEQIIMEISFRDDALLRWPHRQYKHPTKRGLVTVAGKPSDDLHPKTRDSILRQAGLNEDGSQAGKPGRGES
jgi:HicA-like toxin of HicAB toxin-antitoxin system